VCCEECLKMRAPFIDFKDQCHCVSVNYHWWPWRVYAFVTSFSLILWLDGISKKDTIKLPCEVWFDCI
jgi:hypothetical protein